MKHDERSVQRLCTHRRDGLRIANRWQCERCFSQWHEARVAKAAAAALTIAMDLPSFHLDTATPANVE